MKHHSSTLAYIVGVALGDGNLSCPNKRAIRLRITCDLVYPLLIEEIVAALQKIFPNNKVSICKMKKGTYIDISVYSNTLKDLMPWEFGKGSKFAQQAHVPQWILKHKSYLKNCLKGLLQTDGSIYYDRNYIMVNFTNLTKPLVDDVYNMITTLGYRPRLYSSKQKNGNIKHVVRLSRNVQSFLNEIKLRKN